MPGIRRLKAELQQVLPNALKENRPADWQVASRLVNMVAIAWSVTGRSLHENRGLGISIPWATGDIVPVKEAAVSTLNCKNVPTNPASVER